jgi:hypothetical protein
MKEPRAKRPKPHKIPSERLGASMRCFSIMGRTVRHSQVLHRAARSLQE